MILFHGSPLPDLKILKPLPGHRPKGMSRGPIIFATPDFRTAIMHSRQWIDRDLQFGTVNILKGPRQTEWLVEEARPGGLKLLDGPGYI